MMAVKRSAGVALQVNLRIAQMSNSKVENMGISDLSKRTHVL